MSCLEDRVDFQPFKAVTTSTIYTQAVDIRKMARDENAFGVEHAFCAAKAESALISTLRDMLGGRNFESRR